jgi:hypothetical protein
VPAIDGEASRELAVVPRVVAVPVNEQVERHKIQLGPRGDCSGGFTTRFTSFVVHQRPYK